MIRTPFISGGGPKVWAKAPPAISTDNITRHTDLNARRGKESSLKLEGNIPPAVDGREVSNRWGRTLESSAAVSAAGDCLEQGRGAGVLARRAESETPSRQPARCR